MMKCNDANTDVVQQSTYVVFDIGAWLGDHIAVIM